MIYKRYQYYSKTGVTWSKWFPWDSNDKPKIQLGKLLNEYKDE
jgi:hypothetical protein